MAFATPIQQRAPAAGAPAVGDAAVDENRVFAAAEPSPQRPEGGSPQKQPVNRDLAFDMGEAGPGAFYARLQQVAALPPAQANNGPQGVPPPAGSPGK